MKFLLLGMTLGLVLALTICIAVERFFWRTSINHRSPWKIREKRKRLLRPHSPVGRVFGDRGTTKSAADGSPVCWTDSLDSV